MKLCETALTWIYIFRLVMMNMRAFPMRAPFSNRGAPLHTSQRPSRHWDGLHGQAPESCDRKVCRARTAGHRLIDDPHPLRSASRRWFNDTIIEGGEGPEHQEDTVTMLVRMVCYQLDNMMPCCFSSGAVADAEWISSLSCKKMHTMIFCSKTLMGLSDCPWEKTSSENMRNLRMWAKPLDSWMIMEAKKWTRMESETKFLFQIIIFRLGQQHRGNHTTTANWPLSNVRDQFRPALLRQTAPDSGEKLRWVGSGYTSTNIYALYECIYLYIFHAGLDISIFWVYI